MSVEQSELTKILSDPYGDTIEDVRAIGGVLTVDLLNVAYENGYFPWPHEGYPMLWFAPRRRGIIDFKKFHQPRSYLKWEKKYKSQYTIKFNSNFLDVIKGCEKLVRKGQQGTWVTPEIRQAYFLMFQAGYAVCCEVYKAGKLVGGIYGVQSKNYVSLESMFHLEDNTSKLALCEMVQFLKDQGYAWVDIQMVSNVSEAFGGIYISREKFIKLIGK